MASANRDARGNAIVQFVGPDRRRRTISLGKISDANVEIIRHRVGLLNVAQQHGHELDYELAKWLAKMPDKMHAKLAAVGLVAPRASAAIAEFMQTYITGRTDLKGRSL